MAGALAQELNAQFVLDTWAREHDVLVVPHSEFSSFWRRAVSFREARHIPIWLDYSHRNPLPNCQSQNVMVMKWDIL